MPCFLRHMSYHHDDDDNDGGDDDGNTSHGLQSVYNVALPERVNVIKTQMLVNLLMILILVEVLSLYQRWFIVMNVEELIGTTTFQVWKSHYRDDFSDIVLLHVCENEGISFILKSLITTIILVWCPILSLNCLSSITPWSHLWMKWRIKTNGKILQLLYHQILEGKQLFIHYCYKLK